MLKVLREIEYDSIIKTNVAIIILISNRLNYQVLYAEMGLAKVRKLKLNNFKKRKQFTVELAKDNSNMGKSL